MTYETREASAQAARERVRLSAVQYLHRRTGGQVSMAVIARAIGVAPHILGKVVTASPMTFRTKSLWKRTGTVVMVELHPHLVMA